MEDCNSPIITKKELLDLLRESIKCPYIRFPRDIDVSLQNSTMIVKILYPDQNMQTNGASFEGWILALKAELPEMIKKVVLDYTPPSDLPEGRLGNPRRCHYNRFIYRVNNFLRLYPDWFYLNNDRANEVSDFMDWLKQGRCLMNHSLRDRSSVIKTDKLERQIESWFVFEGGQKSLCKYWEIDQSALFNQLPIGLFYEKILAKNAIFTRGAGAIDLWGKDINGTTLHIIELKCGNNISMGGIGEILFYTSVIYDTCISKDTLFSFGRYGNYANTEDMIAIQNGGKNFNQLYSHILAERYHPLFSEQVVYLLSDGLSKLGIRFDRAKYDYGTKRMPV
jgi:hypothetical protein